MNLRIEKIFKEEMKGDTVCWGIKNINNYETNINDRFCFRAR